MAAVMPMKGLLLCLRRMCGESGELLLTSLRLSCLLLFCTYLMLVHTGAMSPDNVTLYRTARLLYQQPASIFLLGCLGSYLLEQRSRRC